MTTLAPHRLSLPRWFAALVGVTALGIFLQAVTAGLFVNQDGRDGWVTVHGVIADATWVAALVTALVGVRSVRRSHPRLWWGAAALFVLVLAQTGLGHLITDGGQDGLIVVHVPLAFVVFGLTIWLSVVAARTRRDSALATPYLDERQSTAGAAVARPARPSRIRR